MLSLANTSSRACRASRFALLLLAMLAMPPQLAGAQQILEEMNACDRSFYSWRGILWRVGASLLGRRHPILSLVSNLSYRGNTRLSRSRYIRINFSETRVMAPMKM